MNLPPPITSPRTTFHTHPPPLPLSTVLLLYTGLAWIADACQVMLLSFLGPAIKCQWHITSTQESYLSSTIFLGMLFGVTIIGWLSDHYGRKKAFIGATALLGIFGIASAYATNFTSLLLYRAIVGFAVGSTPIAVTILAEFSPARGRGGNLLLMQSFWIVGTLLVAGIAWFTLPYSDGWRSLLIYSSIPLLLLLVGGPLLPETPLWLGAHGRMKEARRVLRYVARINGTTSDELKPEESGGDSEEDEGNIAATDVAADGLENGGSRHHFPPPLPPSDQHQHRQKSSSNIVTHLRMSIQSVMSPSLAKTSICLYIIWFVNAVTYYGLVLLTTALQTAQKQSPCTDDGRPAFTNDDYRAVVITTIAEAPGILIAAALIDRRGRKWTLRAGLLTCGLSILMLVIIQQPSSSNASNNHGFSLFLLFLARASIMAAFSVLYVYTPEIYSTAVRSTGLALCNAFSRTGGIVAPFATVYLVDKGHPGIAATVLGGLCLLATAAAFQLPHETRGRDLAVTILDEEDVMAVDGGGGGGSGEEENHHLGRDDNDDDTRETSALLIR